MKMEIWDPFEEMKKFRKDMDKVFNDFGKISLPKGLKLREPLVDVVDKKNKIVVTAEIPGVDKKDVKVKIEESRIEIKAEKKKEIKVKKKDFFRQERSYSGFYKMISLPSRVNPKKAKKTFKNGLLKIELLKKK